MNKIFTLIAVSLAAMSVNAQEVWKAAEYDLTQATEQTITEGIYGAGTADAPDTSVPGSLITSVITASTENVTMTGMSTPNSLAPWDIEDGKTQVYWELKGKPADDSNPNDALITDACNPKFAQYLMPKGNPEATHWEFVEETENGQSFRVYGTYWNPGDNMPAKGAYWKFDTKAAGTLKLGVYVNKGNHLFYVVDAATKQPLAPASVNVAIYYQNTGFAYESQKDETTGEVIPGTEKYLNEGVMADDYILQHTNGCTQNRPALGYVSFPVEAGKTYYVFNPKSQVGLYGFEFTAAPAAGPEIPANAIYFWESPDGTPVEKGGKIAYMNGDGDRLNYANAGYYTICLNGKKANINDDAPSANAGHMLLTLDQALEVGDVIEITAYRNKNADGKSASIMFYFENGAEWADTKSFVNILSDDENADWDNDGSTPNTNTWEITAAEAGSKTIKLTRNSASTNLFITKFVITRGGANGIENVEVVTPVKNNVIYNLSGQKVDASYKGIIIVNGKKYFNK